MRHKQPSIPPWVRVVETLDRAAWYAYRTQEVFRDELFRGFVSEEAKAAITDRAYRDQTTYLPGGERFEAGLFDWEKRLLDAGTLPAGGRVLLTSAGGGRELQALLQRGYDVTAFEPNEILLAGARRVAGARATVLDGTYDDLVRAASSGGGPLAGLAQRPFDAIWLGWGSITHLLTSAEHLAVFRACRTLCPRGPVVASFFLRHETPRGRAEKLRVLVRKGVEVVGGRKAADGVAYEMNGGFVYWFRESEVLALAHEAGYEVRSFAAHPFPHVVMTPLG